MIATLENKIREKAWDDFLRDLNTKLGAIKLPSDYAHKFYWRIAEDKIVKKNITNQAVIDFLKDFEEIQGRVEDLEYLTENN